MRDLKLLHRILTLSGWLLLAAGAPALAADGSPDPTFNGIGRAIIDAGGSTRLAAIATQPDGKVVAVGEVAIPRADDASNTAFAIARWKADGAPDTSFGTGHTGVVILEIDAGPVGWRKDGATSVAIQPDGKIVVAGYASAPSFQKHVAVARLTALGNLDLDFGDGVGKLTLPQLGYGSACKVLLRRGGEIVLTPLLSANQHVLAQLTSLGALDVDFGLGGLSEGWGCGGVGCGFLIQTLELPNRDLLTLAHTAIGEVILLRFLSGDTGGPGWLDDGFGVDGVATFRPALDSPYPPGFELDHSGRVLVLVMDSGETWKAGLLRVVGDRLDPTFGTAGWAPFTFQPPTASGGGVPDVLQLQPDGKAIVAGTAFVDGSWNFVATRRTADGGGADASFSGGWSTVVFDVGGGLYDEALAIAAAPGRVVLGGIARSDAGWLLAAARLLNSQVWSDGFESGTTWFWSGAN